MGFAARAHRMERAGRRQAKDRAEVRESKAAARPVSDRDDYNGMPLEEWKIALMKDVEERFGPTPDNLVSAGKAGW